MILDRLTTLRKSKTSIQREGQVRQGRLSECPKYRKDAKPKKHTQTLPYKLLNTKIRHLSKQRILYIQFSVLVKSNARMFNCGDNTHRDRLFRTILALNLLSLPKVNFCHPQKFRRLPEGLPHRTLSSPQPLQKDNNPSPHVCPFTQYVNHSQVCSPAH